jgi:purine-binding chemotaxis protein CheW
MSGAVRDRDTKSFSRQAALQMDGGQYLTFSLGEELYGVDILRVQEIKGYTAES